MHVIELVRGYQGVGRNRVVIHVELRRLQRRVMLGLRVRGGEVVAAVGGREEQGAVVFGREIVLVAAVIRIGVVRRSAAEALQRDCPLVLRRNGAGQGVGAWLID